MKLRAKIVVAYLLCACMILPNVQYAAASVLSEWLTGDHINLSWGSEGEEVEKLQSVLMQLGYDCGYIDGDFGAMTYYAVVAFQADHGLIPDGRVGLQTWTCLMGYADQVSGGEESIPSEEPKPEESRPEESRPEESRPEESRPEESQTESSRPGASQPENTQPGNTNPGTPQEKKLSQILNETRLESVQWGSRGDSVRLLQQALNYLGYSCGPVDGDCGGQTYNQIIEFQKTHGQIVDGFCGQQTWSAIKEAVLKKENAETVPSEPKPEESRPEESRPEESRPEESRPEESRPEESRPEESRPEESRPEESRPEESTPEESRPEESQPEGTNPGAAQEKKLSEILNEAKLENVQWGSQGASVALLQQALNRLGYNCGPIDGDCGNQTYNQIIEFQKDHGQIVDGFCGKQTWVAIKAAVLKWEASQAPEPSEPKPEESHPEESHPEESRPEESRPEESRPEESRPEESQPEGTNPGAAQEKKLSEILNEAKLENVQWGSQGASVALLQQALNRLGYNCGPIDGDCGNQTYNQIIEFQKDHGQIVDGFCGKQTWVAIKAAVLKWEASQAPAPSEPKPEESRPEESRPVESRPEESRPEESRPEESRPEESSEESSKPEHEKSLLELLESETLIPLQLGSTGSCVTLLQKCMIQLGYYNSIVDGNFGTRTQSAVLAFQKAEGITQSGKIDAQNWILIKKRVNQAINGIEEDSRGEESSIEESRPEESSEEESRPEESSEEESRPEESSEEESRPEESSEEESRPEESSEEESQPEKTLLELLETETLAPVSEGSTGVSVSILQKCLIQLGYSKSQVDGSFGSQTKAAVIAFQKAEGLTEDGKVDAKTWILIKKRVEQSINGGDESETEEPVPEESVPEESVPEESEPEEDPSKTDVAGLKKGARGNDVYELQVLLTQIGYYVDTPDGSFGAMTERAVKGFQRTHGLTENGIAGPLTLAAMREAEKNPPAYPNNGLKPLTIGTDPDKIWNYLYSEIGNAYGVAGLMGNLMCESALYANSMEDSYQSLMGYTDSQYTIEVDNGVISASTFIYDAVGYGLPGWTYWTLKRDLLNFAKARKASIGNLDMQLEFLVYNLRTEFPAVWSRLVHATSVYEASNYVLFNYERPADMSTSMQNRRAQAGQDFYNRYAKR